MKDATKEDFAALLRNVRMDTIQCAIHDVAGNAKKALEFGKLADEGVESLQEAFDDWFDYADRVATELETLKEALRDSELDKRLNYKPLAEDEP